jgi:sulfur carrier protein ThiS
LHIAVPTARGAECAARHFLTSFILETEILKILYINNDGAGFADHIEIDAETTVSQLFEQRVQGSSSDYLIRVNRQPASADQILQPGDRVSFTPMKIEGAGSV